MSIFVDYITCSIGLRVLKCLLAQFLKETTYCSLLSPVTATLTCFSNMQKSVDLALSVLLRSHWEIRSLIDFWEDINIPKCLIKLYLKVQNVIMTCYNCCLVALWFSSYSQLEMLGGGEVFFFNADEFVPRMFIILSTLCHLNHYNYNSLGNAWTQRIWWAVY